MFSRSLSLLLGVLFFLRMLGQGWGAWGKNPLEGWTFRYAIVDDSVPR